MAKDKLTDYDATAGNNTDIGGISVDEGMLPSNVNNAIREIMSHLKDFAAGTQAVDAVAINGDLTVDTNTLHVDSTNNRVGIGTVLPLENLNVNGTLQLGTPAQNATTAVSITNRVVSDPVDTGRAAITLGTTAGVSSSDSYIAFTTDKYGVSRAERMRIDSTGNVGLGRSPNYKLDAYISGSGSPAIASSNDSIVTVMQSVGTSQGNIGTLTSHPLVFTAGNTERMRILAGGGLTFNGDTAAANALSDFETGSWTPVYQATSAHPTVTYGLQIGRYTKVGNIVTASCRLSANAASGGSGNLLVGGLPYAALNASPLYYAATVGYSPLWVTAAPQTGILSFNGTQISLLTNASSDARGSLATAITPANMFNGTNGCELIMTITYTSN